MLPGAFVVIGGLVAPLARQTHGCPQKFQIYIQYFPHCLVVVTVARGVAGPIAVVPELSASILVAASQRNFYLDFLCFWIPAGQPLTCSVWGAPNPNSSETIWHCSSVRTVFSAHSPVLIDSQSISQQKIFYLCSNMSIRREVQYVFYARYNWFEQAKN